ncbi:MAG: TIGR00730 family Rossman fold protein [Gammaproteobacteria bacterium]|nr:TIGR00730 family Rossman fold protein [Gammaproteobacteria bacterium]
MSDKKVNVTRAPNNALNLPFRAHSSLQPSRDMIEQAKHCDDSAQTLSSSYRLAFDDPEFLLQDEQRAVRLLLEWQKPDQMLNQHQIQATWPIFGSARIFSKPDASARVATLSQALQKDPENPQLLIKLQQAQRLLDKAPFYDECVKLAGLLSDPATTGIDATVITGGGPGIMEAANKGVAKAGRDSIGLNIVLPTEQEPNRYITPEYCFQFHYFAIRKMHFLARAKALFAFPGGYGTLDEVLETLTLVQTRRLKPMPVFLFGEEFWRKIINFDGLVEEGVISASDIELFTFVDTAEQAIAGVKKYYSTE